jgi:hypothetical protein
VWAADTCRANSLASKADQPERRAEGGLVTAEVQAGCLRVFLSRVDERLAALAEDARWPMSGSSPVRKPVAAITASTAISAPELPAPTTKTRLTSSALRSAYCRR